MDPLAWELLLVWEARQYEYEALGRAAYMAAAPRRDRGEPPDCEHEWRGAAPCEWCGWTRAEVEAAEVEGRG